MRALRDMNLPKFVFEDVPLFLGLISDLFPGLDCPRVRYPDFNDAVEQVLEENGYVLLPVQVSRVQCLSLTLAWNSLQNTGWHQTPGSVSEVLVTQAGRLEFNYPEPMGKKKAGLSGTHLKTISSRA